MGIFDRFRRPRKQIVDPVFGELTLERGTWIGRVRLPGATDDVEVGIDANESGPGEHHRAALQEFVSRYAGMRPGFEQVLWTMFRPMLESLTEGERSAGLPRTSGDMLRATTLDGIYLGSTAEMELLFCFVPEAGWDDAMFRVEIRNWQPVPQSLDD